LEALKEDRAWLETDAPTEVWEKNNEAITAIKAALEAKDEAWECVCGANLYIDANGIPRSKASVEPATVMFKPEQEAKDKPMHPEIKKLYEDYFDKCFRESSSLDKCFRDSFSPQRTWVGLTHAEIDYQAKKDDHGVYFALGALWAEAKLKEKNNA